MKKLFLDDFRLPINVFSYTHNIVYAYNAEWDAVKNYNEFCEYIKNKPLPELISFDHDLADEHYEHGSKTNFQDFDYSICKEKTGYHCAEYLIKHCQENELPLPKILIHSMNPVGSQNIKNLFL